MNKLDALKIKDILYDLVINLSNQEEVITINKKNNNEHINADEKIGYLKCLNKLKIEIEELDILEYLEEINDDSEYPIRW